MQGPVDFCGHCGHCGHCVPVASERRAAVLVRAGGALLQELAAVTGTLMRGLALNPDLVNAGAGFLYEATTSADCRLYSIGDEHPAMQRVDKGGAPSTGRVSIPLVKAVPENQ